MNKFLKSFKKLSRNVLQSIAFYPVLLSLAFAVFAVFSLALENWGPVMTFKENVPSLFIQDYETAKSILSIFVGGIISLTVFSFSMVMVVLSQASSNFSPRLLPGLISNSRHQIILGIYVGTLLYCILILTFLGARGIDASAMGLSTMMAALLSVLCIGLFVYFIHNISGAIQIHNIIKRIHKKCETYVDEELSGSEGPDIALTFVDTKDWNVIFSEKTGYFGGFDEDLVHSSLLEKENQIEIIPYPNQHLWEGMPVLRIKSDFSDPDLKNLLFCIDISPDRHEDENGIGNMITLMEIALRAMSPGINDPGTAIDAIEKLGLLMRKFLQLPKMVSSPLEGGNCILIRNNISASELMRIIVQPIRLYCSHDSSVMYVLIGALKFITHGSNISEENKSVVSRELETLRKDIENQVENQADKEILLRKLP